MRSLTCDERDHIWSGKAGPVHRTVGNTHENVFRFAGWNGHQAFPATRRWVIVAPSRNHLIRAAALQFLPNRLKRLLGVTGLAVRNLLAVSRPSTYRIRTIDEWLNEPGA